MSSKNKTYLKVKDHSVSGEVFHLIRNKKYGYLETTPQPASNKLTEYYESDDYISHTNSKRNTFEKAYHLVRRIALKKKLRLINAQLHQSKNLLDVGCGTGDFLQVAQQNGWNIHGIEPNKKARGIANIKTNHAVFNIDHFLKFETAYFDVITLWHVLEHLPNLEMHMHLFKKLLKPHGTLIIAVPNYKSFDAKHYAEFWAAFDVPRHLWHFDKTSFSKLASHFQMDIVKIKPLWFDAFYVSMLSEKYKTGKMNAVKGFWFGLLSNVKAVFTNETSSLIYLIKNK